MKKSDHSRCIRDHTKKDGTTSFYAEVRRKNVHQRKKFRTLTEAKNWVRSKESEILEGRHVPESKSHQPTLSDLIDEYIRLHLSRFPKRLEDQMHLLKWWQTHYGHKLLKEITPSLLAEARYKLLNEPIGHNRQRTGSTVNRYLASLSKAFTIATNELQWITDNPFKKISKLKENPSRNHYLSREQLLSLLSHCKKSPNRNLYPIVLTAASTGMRFGEIVNLLWRQVDFENGYFTLTETKNGDVRFVPIPDQLRAVLDKLDESKNPNDYLFPSKNPAKRHPGSLIRKAFEKALKNAGISNFRFHDLRHTLASHLAMSGATQNMLMDTLGHKSPTMTKRYVHFNKKHIAQALQKTNDALFGEQQEAQ